MKRNPEADTKREFDLRMAHQDRARRRTYQRGNDEGGRESVVRWDKLLACLTFHTLPTCHDLMRAGSHIAREVPRCWPGVRARVPKTKSTNA